MPSATNDTRPALIVHGGAWDIPDDQVEAHLNGVRLAAETGWRLLREGASALDAVQAAVCVMEDDPTFDAGRGSHLNAAGHVELDALIMDGATLSAGSVAAVQRVCHPISLARLVMDKSEHVLLVGSGAAHFAVEHGMHLCRPDDLITPRELQRWREVQRDRRYKTRDSFRKKRHPSDTVGAVALDKKGNLASATSTGGIPNKYPGRVGDSPLIGCGTYADNEVAAVSTTGWGETMIKVVMAKTVIDLIQRNNGDPLKAAHEALAILEKKVKGYGGVIALTPDGQIGVTYNTPRMAYGYLTSARRRPVVSI
jgi:beta-aspartyl-peptidase (threonine type)